METAESMRNKIKMPEDIDERLKLAMSLINDGNTFSASKLLQSITDEEPKMPLAWIELAKICLIIDQTDTAEPPWRIDFRI